MKKITVIQRLLSEYFFILENQEFDRKMLAMKYGVSLATVSNDIKFLKEELGVPIVTREGNGGGQTVYYSYANIKHLSKQQAEALIAVIELVIKHNACIVTPKQFELLISIIDDFWSPLIAKELKEKNK